MKVLVVLCLVAVALGQGPRPGQGPPPRGQRPPGGMGGQRGGDKDEDWNVKPCCFPDQWSGKEYFTTTSKHMDGAVDMEKATQMFHVDFAAGKYKTDIVKYDGMKVSKNKTLITDLNKQYTKGYDHKKKGCFWYSQKMPVLNQCISKKAKFTGSSTMGMGDSAIKVNHFEANMTEHGMKFHMKIGVTAEHCVPIYRKYGGSLGKGALNFTIDSMFFDNKDTIDNPDIFDHDIELSQCTDFKEYDTPEVIKAQAFLQSVFFPKTSPRKCCFPAAFEAKEEILNITMENGTPRVVYQKVPHFSVSSKHLKFRKVYKVYVDNVPTMNMTFIGDLRFGSLFAINKETDECKKYNIPAVSKMGGQCIPAMAKPAGTPTIGLGEDTLDLSTWKMNTSQADFAMSVAHSKGNCIPVSLSGYGKTPQGLNFMVTGGISDVKEGIQDFDVFNPPESCNGVAAEPMSAEIESIIGESVRELTSPVE